MTKDKLKYRIPALPPGRPPPISPDTEELITAALVLWEWLVRLDEPIKARTLLSVLPYLLEGDHRLIELERRTQRILEHLSSADNYRALYTAIWEGTLPDDLRDLAAAAASFPRIAWAIKFAFQKKALCILDAGAGAGTLAAAFAFRGIKTDALNLTERVVDEGNAAARKAVLPLEFYYGDAEEWGEDNYYDLACCFEVLEHVRSPERVIANLKRVVKPSGWILLTTPKGSTTLGENTWAVHPDLFGGPVQHVRVFTERTLRLLLQDEHALEIMEMPSTGAPGSPLLLAASFQVRR